MKSTTLAPAPPPRPSPHAGLCLLLDASAARGSNSQHRVPFRDVRGHLDVVRGDDSWHVLGSV
eukprot:3675062-Rhodomonas_salina.1